MTRDRETRERLLAAAERLFAERGFKKVTVREICRAARANVAAVNYHFGDKLGLYREVLKSAIGAIRATTDQARLAGEGQTAEEQLRRFIVIFLQRVLAPRSEPIHRLLAREVSDPTPALDDVVEQAIRPRIELLSRVIGDIIGCDPDDLRVLRCVGSIQAQSLVFRPNPIAARLGLSIDPTPALIDEAARHIAEFSIGGVRAIGQSDVGVRSARAKLG